MARRPRKLWCTIVTSFFRFTKNNWRDPAHSLLLRTAPSRKEFVMSWSDGYGSRDAHGKSTISKQIFKVLSKVVSDCACFFSNRAKCSWSCKLFSEFRQRRNGTRIQRWPLSSRYAWYANLYFDLIYSPLFPKQTDFLFDCAMKIARPCKSFLIGLSL